MNSHPSSTSSQSNALFLAFPLQLFTAMRTMRLYPPANPQVLRNNKSAFLSLRELLEQSESNTVTLSLSEQKILVNGEQLSEKDQARPQITGLRDFINRINIHSLSFSEAFHEEDCSTFVEVFAELLGKKDFDTSIEDLIAQNSISGVQIDEKKYVVVHKGEQVVKEDELGMLGRGMPVSEEDMINYVLSHGKEEADLHGLPPKIAESILKKLAETTKQYDTPEEMNAAVHDFLNGIGQEKDGTIRAGQIETTAATIAGLDSPALSRFISSLPDTSLSDDMLHATIGHLTPVQLNRLLANVVAQLPSMESGQGFGSLQIDEHSLLNRFIRLAGDSTVKKSIAQNVDAGTMLANPETRLKDLPASLLKRLQQPEWSAPVLANAVQQSFGSQATEGPESSISLSHMLANYEDLLTEEQRGQVVQEAGAELAQTDGFMLSKLIAHNFQGVFGEQLYREIIEQIPENRLDRTVEQLSAEQLNRMVTMLCSTLPATSADHAAKQPDVLKRLLASSKGEQVQTILNQHVDAQQLLNTLNASEELPENLRLRLQDPEWSVPVLLDAVRQADTLPGKNDGQIDIETVNRLLTAYGQILDRETQDRVSATVADRLLSMEGLQLGKRMAHKFKGIFGEKVYDQLVSQSQNADQEDDLEQLPPEQLNRMVTMMTAKLPFKIDIEGEPDYSAVENSELQHLLNSPRKHEVQQAIEQNFDARLLLNNPQTTLAELPPHLLERLKQPEWSGRVLANAMQQAMDPELSENGSINISAFNTILGHFEQLLDPDTQQQITSQAGTRLAASEGAALGNLLVQKFKGAMGGRLYQQIVDQVPAQTLNETLESFDPEMLNKMLSILAVQLPVQLNEFGEAELEHIHHPGLKKLLQSSKKETISNTLSQKLQAKALLQQNSQTPTLSEHIQARLREPNWSGPVLVSALQQATDPTLSEEGSVDQAAFSRILNYYEQLLDQSTQSSVSALAGSQLAGMEGAALANLLSHRFKGMFGEKLYREILKQIPDDLLESTVDTLSIRQINKLIAILTTEPDGEGAELKTAEEKTFLKRLASTKKSPIIKQVVAQQLDAQLLRSSQASAEHLPDRVKLRLQQPGWSSPVLTAAAHMAVDPELSSNDRIDIKGFNQILTAYETLLNEEKQKRIAAEAGARIAEDLEEKELSLILIQKYKGLFGEKFYSEVIRNLSEEKFSRLAEQMQRFATGQEMLPGDEMNSDVQEAYDALLKTVREQKLHTVVKIQEKKQSEQEEKQQSRINEGLKGLMNGDPDALRSRTFCAALPGKIMAALNGQRLEEADALLAQLAIAQQAADDELKTNSVGTLAAAAEALSENGHWPRLIRLLPALEQTLHSMNANEESITKAINAVSALAYHHLTREQYSHAYDTIRSIKRIVDNTDRKVSEAVRLNAGNALEQISTREILTKLLTTFLEAGEGSDTAGSLLSEMGETSARYQIEHLMKSESRFERKRLLDLIKQSGKIARQLLQEQLQQPSPWYVHRNVIRLLGEMGEPSILLKLQPFLDHDDLRVQQETLSAAGRLGGEDISEFLIRALIHVDDSLKAKAASLMKIFPDERFVGHLTELLESTAPFQGKNKDTLQIAICRALAAIGSRKALVSLQRVVQSKNVLGKAAFSESVRMEAEKTMRILRSTAPSMPEDADQEAGQAENPPVSVKEQHAYQQDLEKKEQTIFDLAGQGNIDEAKKNLFDLISNTARKGDFDNAERLRERFYEIDPMALSEIIRSGEIIEQEKGGSIRENDLEIWAKLTDKLTPEEFHTMYHEFTERTYGPEEPLVNQGTLSNELFFINQGSVKVSHLIGNKELFITTLNRGQVAGENFFNPSVWTVSLTALTPARVYRLKQEQLAKWQKQFPGLQSKLEKFYCENNEVSDLIQKKGLERRSEKRFQLSRKIQVQPTDNRGKPIGKGFRAELADLSRGGLAFLIRITRKENTKLLLGRKMQVVLPVGLKGEYLYLKGTAIGIQPHDLLSNDYGVHFKFDILLENDAMQQILG